MPWAFLIVAGLLEIGWASAMKQSAGFTRLLPTLLTFALMFASFGLLAAAMRSLPLGTAYAVWTGIGALGAFVVGLLWFGESAHPMRILAALLILAGIALMKWAPAG
ncbi:QacE family quaternary ammonium compound efflux SMR transporter [Aureimonas flava]|uniref:Guanidinium exporter n=1 Tax=Aureimonas flava TaxID=2320271 RepID=A0A3A1WPW6_9HYPH|nr:multidrug efflux SMR transporter [Aureimonas flava]RIY02793.1 QacE family quaternary ammonium compound efflux SMR transporter [Aureimonas flava]